MTMNSEIFPLLQEMNLKGPFAYLDSAATTLKPLAVIEAVSRFYRSQTANVHRGVYDLAAQATALYEEARERAARFVGAESEREIIFTSGATAGLNIVASGLEGDFKSGDVIILSILEHHSNILPWQRLAKRKGARIEWIPIRQDGSLDEERYQQILQSGRVKLVSLTLVSHVLGNHIDVRHFFQLARAARVRWTVADASQAVLRQTLSVYNLECDALVFSGHKALGPSGVGVLYANRKLQEVMEPLMIGGGMVAEVLDESSSWREGPHAFEGGTPPIEQAIALGEALQLVRSQSLPEIAQKESLLIERAAAALRSRNDCRLYGWASSPSSKAAHAGILAFTVDGIHPHDVAQWFADHGVAVRAGHHCAQILHRRLGGEALLGTTRVSLAPYSTSRDLDLFVASLSGLESLRR